MVGPVVSQTPIIGPLRGDAVEKQADERRIQDKVSREVTQASGSSDGTKDEILTAEGVVNKASTGVLSTNSRLSIEADDETGDYIYRVYDRETGELIRQWPREELLNVAGAAAELPSGLIDEKA